MTVQKNLLAGFSLILLRKEVNGGDNTNCGSTQLWIQFWIGTNLGSVSRRRWATQAAQSWRLSTAPTYEGGQPWS